MHTPMIYTCLCELIMYYKINAVLGFWKLMLILSPVGPFDLLMRDVVS